MVNKSVLGISVVVVVAALSVGVVVGMQLGGSPAPSDGPTEQPGDGEEPDDGGGATATATPSEPTATATPTGTATATPVPTEREPYVPASYFDEAEIAQFIVEFINEGREERTLDPLTATGTTADKLARMAGGHSDEMGRIDRTVHEIDGVDSGDRYRNNGLYDTCRFQASGKAYVRNADNNDFEAIGYTRAGQPYTQDGTERFNGGEREVAKAIVDNWFATNPYKERLTYANANRLGVGVNVSENGDVYATANVCG